MFDRLAQARKVVEGHSREHVMFNVVLHVPVKKGRQPATRVSSAAEAKIGGVGRQSDMLWHSAQHLQPGAILTSESDDDNQEPMTGDDKKCRQGEVSQEDNASPVAVVTAKLGFSFGQDSFHPVGGKK